MRSAATDIAKASRAKRVVGELHNGPELLANGVGTHAVGGMCSSNERSAKSIRAEPSISGREETNH